MTSFLPTHPYKKKNTYKRKMNSSLSQVGKQFFFLSITFWHFIHTPSDTNLEINENGDNIKEHQLNYVLYLYLDYCPYLCGCCRNASAVVSSGLLQVYIDLGDLQGILSLTLYLINEGGLFSFHCSFLEISFHSTAYIQGYLLVPIGTMALWVKALVCDFVGIMVVRSIPVSGSVY